jgi:hypothetical protein
MQKAEENQGEKAFQRRFSGVLASIEDSPSVELMTAEGLYYNGKDETYKSAQT